MAWNLDDVHAWIEQLEQCPAGSVGDEYVKDNNKFLNDSRQDGLWNARRELCERRQKAVVDYQKRKKG